MSGPPIGLFGNERPAHFPDAPGWKGPHETGRDAAGAIAPKCGRLQRLTLDVIRAAARNGLTADEASAALRLDRWSIQPRISELRAKGLIVASGLRRRNASGKNAVVWVAVELAKDAA